MIAFFERYGKYNWIDDRNVFVGFDSNQCCCEDFGYEYYKTPKTIDLDYEKYLITKDYTNKTKKTKVEWIKSYEVSDKEIELEKLYFDVTSEPMSESDGEYESGGAVWFEMKHIDGDPNFRYYLKIYNNHNGYYGHGFEFMKDCLVDKYMSETDPGYGSMEGEVIESGCL